MNKNSDFQKKKGFTLIELIITIALIGIVVTMASSFFVYNLKIFNKSEDNAAVQFDVRMASDHVTTTLRNSTLVSLTDTTMTHVMNLASIKAKYPLITSVSFQIVYENSNYFVSYVIGGNIADGSAPYEINSKVFLDNIVTAITGTATEIHFSK